MPSKKTPPSIESYVSEILFLTELAKKARYFHTKWYMNKKTSSAEDFAVLIVSIEDHISKLDEQRIKVLRTESKLKKPT